MWLFGKRKEVAKQEKTWIANIKFTSEHGNVLASFQITTDKNTENTKENVLKAGQVIINTLYSEERDLGLFLLNDLVLCVNKKFVAVASIEPKLIATKK